MQTSIIKADLKKLGKTVVLFAKSGGGLMPEAAKLDKQLKGVVSAALKNSRFQGEVEEIFGITTPAGLGIARIFVAGVGDVKGGTSAEWRSAGIAAGKVLDGAGVAEATVLVEKSGKLPENITSEALMDGINLAVYRFDQLKTELKPYQKGKFKKLYVAISEKEGKLLAKKVKEHAGLFDGVALARDLVNLPPNIANPDLMVEEAKKLKKLGIKVEILGEKQLEKLGLRLLLGVGRGAAQESRLIVMKYEGGTKKDPLHAIVGKGVMFDTGGYDLKPSPSMFHMKGDMAGAASVMGTMRALAGRKSKVNVVGVCGCVMNMVSSNAQLPSDVVKSYKGLTVEIGNTDAEGRLVLADALAYILDKEKPKEVIDLATLTGACMIALGTAYAGLFSNNDKLANGLRAAGEETGERLWRLPIGPEYTRALKSPVADTSSTGTTRYGGASTAAAFLERFVNKTPWAHLDIAGVGMAEKIPGSMPITGASGFGVRLLTRYLEEHA